MAESEAIEALADIAAVAATYFSVFMSLTFAYLTVAYLVGATLNKFQLVLTTAIYVLSAAMMGASTTVWTKAWMKLYNREQTVFTGSWVADSFNWETTLSILLTAVVIASVYFMYDIRKRAT
ncbi:MAG: hypothetical protein ACU84Q_17085 [Gammaproteobacteria bacterium]